MCIKRALISSIERLRPTAPRVSSSQFFIHHTLSASRSYAPHTHGPFASAAATAHLLSALPSHVLHSPPKNTSYTRASCPDKLFPPPHHARYARVQATFVKRAPHFPPLTRSHARHTHSKSRSARGTAFQRPYHATQYSLNNIRHTTHGTRHTAAAAAGDAITRR
jgi:hypothetical protein